MSLNTRGEYYKAISFPFTGYMITTQLVILMMEEDKMFGIPDPINRSSSGSLKIVGVWSDYGRYDIGSLPNLL